MTATGRTGLLFDPICRQHNPGAGHPERAERLDAARAGAVQAASPPDILDLPVRQATLAELALVHAPDYIAAVRREITAGYGCLTTGDTDVSRGSWTAALAAAGGVLAACDAVMADTVVNAFCVVRPPGHHATPDRGMGFCVFNNIAVAARYLQHRHALERILIVDWDVHHGNGTQDAFYGDPTVFYFSTHLSPFYPGSGQADEAGTGKGQGFTLNCPLPAGSGSAEVLDAFRRRLVPAMRLFKPQFVLVSAGFDPLNGDPIGRMTLKPEDFYELTLIVGQIAADYAERRLVSALEGGYDLRGLEAACYAHMAGLISARDLAAQPAPSTRSPSR